MDSSNRKPEDLIQDIVSFLEREKEMYGAFSLSDKKLEADPGTSKKSLNEENSPAEKPDPVTHQTSDPGTQNLDDEKNQMESENKSIYERLDECKTLEKLRNLCEEADELKTDLENTNLVFGVGNPSADLMLIGEAPGAEEDRQGEPFVGKAGQLLNKILAAIDFSRDNVYIANILKHRPPNNRNPKAEERERSLPFLLKQIELIEPKLILCLGKVAAQTLLDSDQSLGRMRGKFHSFKEKYELLATYHPAALLRNKKWKRPTWEDVQKLRNRYDELGCKP